MSTETQANKIKAKLLINEDDLFDSIIDMSAELVKLDSSGRVHIITEAKLKDQYSVTLYMIGKCLAKHAELVTDEAIDADEISSALGIKKPVVQARLSDLKKEGVLEVIEKGRYRIVMPRMHSTLKEIINNVKGGKQ